MTKLRKIAAGASVAALALAGLAATSASAKTYILSVDSGGASIDDVNGFGSYGVLALANNTYDFVFTLDNPLLGTTSVQLQGETTRGIAEAVSFQLYSFTPPSVGPITLASLAAGTLVGSVGPKTLSPTLSFNLDPGSYYVNVVFNSDLTGSKEAISGNVTTVSVPEPASWALMLVGVGAVGAGLRRRNAKVSAAA